MNTLELNVKLDPKDPWSDILIAELADYGFESFVATEDGILAYAPENTDYEDAMTRSSLASVESVKVEVSKSIIAQKNWNKEWESNFDPVYVEEHASIVAPFHDKKDAKGLIVEIQPQMSFGTGHHQTTWLMTKSMFELESIPKNVLDMGTGTGVLAIFAEKLGADRVLAIDIEDWSVENAIENVARNKGLNVECICGDVDKIGDEHFGLILANINKNVLKLHMESYSKALDNDGFLLLSGFFSTDVEELVEFAGKFNLTLVDTKTKDEWACIQLQKTN